MLPYVTESKIPITIKYIITLCITTKTLLIKIRYYQLWAFWFQDVKMCYKMNFCIFWSMKFNNVNACNILDIGTCQGENLSREKG